MSEGKNKKWLIVLVLFLVFALIIFQIFIFLRKKNDGTISTEKAETMNNNNNSFPVETIKPTESVKKVKDKPVFEGEFFDMPTKNDSFLKLKNPFRKENNVYVLDSDSALVKEDPDFNIEFQYVSSEGPFYFLALKNKDIQKARDRAEQALLSYLGITQQQACEIDVRIGFPASVNEKLGGEIFGLSFCPNGKSFPNNWNQ